MKIAPRLLVSSLVLSFAWTTGCKTTLQAPVATARAAFTNAPDVPHTATLMLTHIPGRSTPQIATLDDPGFTYLMNASLSVTPPGLTEDAFLLQFFSNRSTYLSGDRFTNEVLRRNMDFVEPFIRNVTVLTKDAPRAASSTTTATGSIDPRQSGTRAWLARWAAADVVMPWTRALPAPANLTVTAPGGSPTGFDLKFVTDSIGATIKARVAARFDPSSPATADPDPGVRSGNVTFAGYIPNVIGAQDSPTRRVRGVGLIFAVDLQVRGVAIPGTGRFDVGTAYHPCTVWVPIALLFESDGSNGIRLTIDPTDLGGTPAATMAARVGVEVFPAAPLPWEQAIATEIAGRLQAGFAAAMNAPPPTTTPTPSDLLSVLFNQVRGFRPLGQNFDVLMFPESGSPEGSPIPVTSLRYRIQFIE